MSWPIEGMGGWVRGKLQVWLEILGDFSQAHGLPSKVRALRVVVGIPWLRGHRNSRPFQGLVGCSKLTTEWRLSLPRLRSAGEPAVLSVGEGQRGQGGRPVDFYGLGEGPAGGLKPIVEGGGLHRGPGVSRLGSEDCRLCPGSGG